MPQAIHEYAASYMQGNRQAYPTTAKAVARNLTDNYKVVLKNNQKPKKKPTNQSSEEESSQTAGGHVQENADDSQEGTQGAHIIVNNESLGRKSYTIDQILRAHPIDDPIWNLNSTMSDEEEDVNKEQLLQKIDHLAITDTDQDFQSGRH